MLVYLRDRSAQAVLPAATLSTSPTHSTLTSGQPVPALILCHQALGRVAREFQYLSHRYDSTQKYPHSTSWNWTPDLEVDALTTRLTRWCVARVWSDQETRHTYNLCTCTVEFFTATPGFCSSLFICCHKVVLAQFDSILSQNALRCSQLFCRHQ